MNFGDLTDSDDEDVGEEFQQIIEEVTAAVNIAAARQPAQKKAKNAASSSCPESSEPVNPYQTAEYVAVGMSSMFNKYLLDSTLLYRGAQMANPFEKAADVATLRSQAEADRCKEVFVKFASDDLFKRYEFDEHNVCCGISKPIATAVAAASGVPATVSASASVSSSTSTSLFNKAHSLSSRSSRSAHKQSEETRRCRARWSCTSRPVRRRRRSACPAASTLLPASPRRSL